MLTVATPVVAAAAPLELLALGLAGVAVVVAVGSALAALGARRAVEAPAEEVEERAPA